VAVRHAALQALTAMVPLLDKAARERYVPPLRRLLRPPLDLAPPTARVAAKLMSALPLALCPMVPSDRTLVFSAFHALAGQADLETRLHCARAFPAVVMALLTEGGASLDGPFVATFYALATDSEVRCCVCR
jgi:hypothetical protein